MSGPVQTQRHLPEAVTARVFPQKRSQDELHLVRSTEAGEPGADGLPAASPVELVDTFTEVEHATIPLLSTAAKTALETKSTPRTALHHTARLTVAGAAGKSGPGLMSHVERERSIGADSATPLHHSTVANHVLRTPSKPRDTSDLSAQLMEVGAVGATGQNQVPLVETTATSREQGNATTQLRPTMEETVTVFQLKPSQFRFRDALWTEDGTRGAIGRTAASPVDSVELPRDPEDATCRSPPMEANCAMEISSKRDLATAHHARLMVVGPAGASGRSAA